MAPFRLRRETQKDTGSTCIPIMAADSTFYRKILYLNNNETYLQGKVPLLIRRLEGSCPALAMIKAGRGRFDFRVQRGLVPEG
jgi:hypothetical protein